MKNFLIFLVLVFFSTLQLHLYSQVTQEWVRSYSGPGNQNDWAGTVKVDNNGFIFVTGGCIRSATGQDFCTIKYGSTGDTIWIAWFDRSGDTDAGRDMKIDAAGNIYVTGPSRGTNLDFATVKYNSQGIEQWRRFYNGIFNGDDDAYRLEIDNAGFIYVAGLSGSDFATIKYDSLGNQLWVSRYNGPGNSMDVPFDIKVDAIGNVYVAGYSTGVGLNNDFTTVKYNSSGTQLWVRIKDGSTQFDDRAYSIALDNSNNVYVTGKIGQPGILSVYFTIKYNTNGDSIWSAIYHGSGNGDNACKVLVDYNNDVIVAGTSIGSSSNADYCIVKYNSSGTQQWVYRYNGTGNSDDQINDMSLDSNQNIYVTGYSSGLNTYKDYATVKVNALGIQQWVARYNSLGISTDKAYSIAVGNDGCVYATGEGSINGNQDYITVKYSQIVSINYTGLETPSSFFLSQNYPNPFNPNTKINFSIPLLRGVTEGGGVLVNIVVFDNLGREVTTLVNEQLKPGGYEVDWNASNHPSGVYFYKLVAGEFTETKKMVLIK